MRDRCQITDLHFHDTRHEACTRLARKLEVLDLARMIGHKDLRSLMIYYNATASELQRGLISLVCVVFLSLAHHPIVHSTSLIALPSSSVFLDRT